MLARIISLLAVLALGCDPGSGTYLDYDGLGAPDDGVGAPDDGVGAPDDGVGAPECACDGPEPPALRLVGNEPCVDQQALFRSGVSYGDAPLAWVHGDGGAWQSPIHLGYDGTAWVDCGPDGHYVEVWGRRR